MTHPCHEYETKIIDMTLEMLEISEQISVLEHIDQCVECKAYWERLQAVEEQVERWTGAECMSDKVEKVIEKLNATDLHQEPGVQNRQIGWTMGWKQIAAIFIIAVGVMLQAVYFVHIRPGLRNTIEEGLHGNSNGTTQPVPSNQAEYAKRLEREKQQVEQARTGGRMGQLEIMLDTGLPETQILAANILADIGDDSVLDTLEKRSAKWPKYGTENPFQKAIEAIQKRLPETNTMQ
ncbi:MAG: hypothetical protein ABFD91_02465 [Anaerohalosphaeraceae bacterium]